MRNRMVFITLFSVFILLLSGCGGGQPEKAQEESGAAVSSSQKLDPANSADTQAIDLEQAKDVAFQHAGVSADKAERVKAELEHEDGMQVYEISFDSENQEYEYEINAQTGEILHYDQEMRD